MYIIITIITLIKFVKCPHGHKAKLLFAIFFKAKCSFSFLFYKNSVFKFLFIFFLFPPLFVASKSDKTDVDSTHSSSCLSHHGSVYTGEHIIKNTGELPTKKVENLVIPPDALYGQQQQQQQQHHQPSSYISYEAVFNDSKVNFCEPNPSNDKFIRKK